MIRPMIPGRKLMVAYDASQYGIGAILYQEDDTLPGKKRFICFASRTLNYKGIIQWLVVNYWP